MLESPRLRAQRVRRAFTLVELLVVIGIIALLIAILLPALTNARRAAEKTACMSNMTQLTTAYLMYAQDNKGALVDPNTSGTGWVNTGNVDGSVTQGPLYPYCKNSGCDHCPSDNITHLRSYSINDYLNGNGSQTGSHPEDINLPPTHALKLTQIKHAVDTLVFVEEWDQRAAYNEGSFWLCYQGDAWIDYPSHPHVHGANVSFVDGHAEYWLYSDPRTLTINGPYATTVNNADLKRYETHVGYPPR